MDIANPGYEKSLSGGHGPRRFYAGAALSPLGTHAEVQPALNFYGDPEETEKEVQSSAEMAVTKEEFQGEQTAPAPKFSAAQPEVADWSEGAGALCACTAVSH